MRKVLVGLSLVAVACGGQQSSRILSESSTEQSNMQLQVERTKDGTRFLKCDDQGECSNLIEGRDSFSDEALGQYIGEENREFFVAFAKDVAIGIAAVALLYPYAQGIPVLTTNVKKIGNYLRDGLAYVGRGIRANKLLPSNEAGVYAKILNAVTHKYTLTTLSVVAIGGASAWKFESLDPTTHSANSSTLTDAMNGETSAKSSEELIERLTQILSEVPAN